MFLVSTDPYYCNLVNSIISSWKDSVFVVAQNVTIYKKHFLFNLFPCARMV